MLRRQALGVISNQCSFNQVASKPPHATQKSAPILNPSHIKDENEPPVALQTKKSTFDFEIFQEDYDATKSSDDALVKFAAKHGFNYEAKQIEKENLLKKQPVIFSNDYEEEEEVEEEEEEETEDYDDYEEEEEEEDLEEEGISRLNLAGLAESSNESMKAAESAIGRLADVNTSGQMDFSMDEESKQAQSLSEYENALANCFEYKDDILNYMRKMELQNRAKANYMKKQQDITSSMRSILIDWLVEVSEEYKLHTETLYLAVNYTDRFLSQMSVLRGKLQLVGTASMYIAAKYEEISPPDVTEFVYITDDTYTKKQVLRMEHLLLKVLDFRMNTPTCNCFLTHYLRFLKMFELNTCDKVEHLARYLAELTLIDSETFLGYLPSQIAAASIYLAMNIVGKAWNKQIGEQLGYEVNEIEECVLDLLKMMQKAPEHPQQAIQEKYKQSKFSQVALIEAPDSVDICN